MIPHGFLLGFAGRDPHKTLSISWSKGLVVRPGSTIFWDEIGAPALLNPAYKGQFFQPHPGAVGMLRAELFEAAAAAGLRPRTIRRAADLSLVGEAEFLWLAGEAWTPKEATALARGAKGVPCFFGAFWVGSPLHLALGREPAPGSADNL